MTFIEKIYNLFTPVPATDKGYDCNPFRPEQHFFFIFLNMSVTSVHY
ncbi:hypothetical protein M085_5021 [Bacteroides fragilis str. 3986 N(B)19]|nr:hypothetical protein M085_5021 [Bacteroides fragilis str. 3986 N(B)19]